MPQRNVGAVALAALLLISFAPCVGFCQEATAPAANAERLQWWREARFGMFIHWGPVSLKGTEIGWSRGAGVPIEEYDSLYKQFNPTAFNADEWVAVAKAAGMKYMVLTTKHHDGFCLWDTKQTDYCIMGSPFARDIVRELSEACKRGGIRFGTYYSVCDWHHPLFPFGSPGGSTAKPNPDLEGYTEYVRQQVRELIENYGPLNTLWFDVPQGFDAQRGQAMVDYVRSLQPDILINNRCANPGDYDTPEQQVGTFSMGRPWETCMTICQQWAWRPDDRMKTLKECLQTLVRCAGGDGNLLFNVGPMPTGEIEPRQVERLKEMGGWLQQYGQTIYGTRGGPYRPTRSLASTRRDNRIYLHVLSFGEGPLTLPPLPVKVTGVNVLTGGSCTYEQTEQALTLNVPADARQDIDTVIELELSGSAMDIPPLRIPSGIKAQASNICGKDETWAPDQAFDGDPGTRWATDGGTHSAWVEVDLGKPTQIEGVRMSESCGERVQKFELQYKVGEEWRVATEGTTIGESFVRRFEPVMAQVVRLDILEATEGPTLWEIELLPVGKTRASNIYQESDAFSPEKAFDGDPLTRWATDGGTHSAWIQTELDKPTTIGRLKVLEAYAGRVQRFELQYQVGEEWKTALTGTTLGEQYEQSFAPAEAQRWRLNILEATEGPTLWEVQLLAPAG